MALTHVFTLPTWLSFIKLEEKQNLDNANQNNWSLNNLIV